MSIYLRRKKFCCFLERSNKILCLGRHLINLRVTTKRPLLCSYFLYCFSKSSKYLFLTVEEIGFFYGGLKKFSLHWCKF